MTKRNPPWNRDELLITLDFYLQHTPTIPAKNSTEITELSDILNHLQSKLGGNIPDRFRNTNGVYMKLMNFRRFDPDYEGVGLQRGNKDEKVVWDLYAHKPNELSKIAEAICSSISSDTVVPSSDVVTSDEEEAEEGKILTRIHRYRERDLKLAKRKKEAFMQENGALFCEVCKFDFSKNYGEHGAGFIECHHTKPISEIDVGTKTKLSDLAVVCSNCHRMIHRKRPWLSIADLKLMLSIVRERSN